MLIIVVIVAILAVVLCGWNPGDLGDVPLDVFHAALVYEAIIVTVFGLLLGLAAQFLVGKTTRYRPKAPQGDFVARLRLWGWIVFAVGCIVAFLIATACWTYHQDTNGLTQGLPFLGLVAAGTAAIGMGYMLGCSLRTWGGSYAYWRKPRKI